MKKLAVQSLTMKTLKCFHCFEKVAKHRLTIQDRTAVVHLCLCDDCVVLPTDKLVK